MSASVTWLAHVLGYRPQRSILIGAGVPSGAPDIARRSFSRARESRDITVPTGNRQHLRDFLVAHLLDRGQHQHLALIGRQSSELAQHLEQLDAGLLGRAHRQLPGGVALAIAVDRHVLRIPRRGRELVDEHVVHDREHPRPQVASDRPQPALLPSPRERILDEVVGARRVAGQHPRIAAQPRNRGHQVGLGQRWIDDHACITQCAPQRVRNTRTLRRRYYAAAERGIVHFAACQAPFRKPSPVLSPGFWSFDHA